MCHQCQYWNVDYIPSNSRNWGRGFDRLGQYLHLRLVQYAKSGQVFWIGGNDLGFCFCRGANIGRRFY
jgi:hypothetical protein